MHRRALVSCLLAVVLAGLGACHNKKVSNPIADLNSKQPDKVLFDRAMEAMKHNKFEVARMSLQTMINAYPDSEYVARAKLAVGDSWYAEGGTAALSQAESEYKDFITFFPTMPEAAEAQMKIANIHYSQMEKPDRDFTHAKRAEDEYRQMILQFPDSKLVPQAKERLREVQEVLAEREYRIGRFYYMRESWPAAIARLKSLADAYPLYSGADEALFLLGDAYERQAQFVRASKAPEQMKAALIKDEENHAAEAFSRIVTRYPVTDRAGDAKQRLAELHRPVPNPTPEALAQNKAEEESRGRMGMISRAWENFHKRPDMTQTAKVGDPTLIDPKPVSAPDIVKSSMDVITGKASAGHTVSVETRGTGAPPPSEAAPRSDSATPSSSNSSESTGIPELTPLTSGASNASAGAASGTSSSTSTAPAATAPAATGSGDGAPVPPPPQVNEVTPNSTDSSATSGQNAGASSTTDNQESSSKAKKKKGLRKLVPF